MRLQRGTYAPKAPVTDWRPRGKGSERIIGSNGEVNGSNKMDLMRQIGTWMEAVEAGVVARRDSETLSLDEQRRRIADRQQILAEALDDQTGQKWISLGQSMAEEIYETLGREGFTRKILGFKPIKRGDQARIAIRRKDVIAYYFATTDATTVATSVRQSYIYPQDAKLTARILIDDLELELADRNVAQAA